MPASSPRSRPNEITLIVVLIALLLLLPPLIGLWAFAGSYWLTPYLIWSAIIMLGYLLQRYLEKHAV